MGDTNCVLSKGSRFSPMVLFLSVLLLTMFVGLSILIFPLPSSAETTVVNAQSDSYGWAMNRYSAPAGCSSGYMLPYPYSVSYTLQTGNGSYGYHPWGGLMQYAFDFGNGHPEGKIEASQGGTVRWVQESNTATGGPGNYVVIYHGQDADAYLHILPQSASKYGIRPGVDVQRGQVIGEVGSVGHSTGPHIHFQRQQQSDILLDGITNSLPACFTDPDVIRQNPDGVPTEHNQYISANIPPGKVGVAFWVGPLASKAEVIFEVRPPNYYSYLLYGPRFVQTVYPDANNNYTVLLNDVSPGYYDILVKPRGWLRKQSKGIYLNSGSNYLDWSLTYASYLGVTPAGDLNGDNTVDMSDFDILAMDYRCINNKCPRSDLDRDGRVDVADFSLLSDGYRQDGDGGPMPPIVFTNAGSPSSATNKRVLNSGPGRLILSSSNPSSQRSPTSYQVGDIISLTVQYDTGGKGIDGVGSLIHYDPGVLEFMGYQPLNSSFSITGTTSLTHGFKYLAFSAIGAPPITGTGDIVTVGFRAIRSTPMTTVALKRDSGLEWNSKISEQATAQDILGQVINQSFGVVGGSSRPIRTGSIVTPLGGEYINSKITRVDLTADDTVGGIDKIALEAYYDGAWHTVGSTDGFKDSSLNSGTGANQAVGSLALQPDGKILIAGAFTQVNGISRNYVARLNADGSVDPLFNSPLQMALGNFVDQISLQPDGKIVLIGNFTRNGTDYNRIMRLNPNGSLDTGFSLATWPSDWIQTHAIQSDGKIVIAGDFKWIDTTSRQYVARLNADGTLDPTFDPGTGPNLGVIVTAIQQDGKILIGGQFTQVNGITRNHIARLNSDGTLDATFDPGVGPNDNVFALSLQPEGKIVIAGAFTQVNSLVHNHIARLNGNGTLDSSFNAGGGANDWVQAIAIQSDQTILIGGDFTQVGGSSRNHIARLNRNGTLDTAFNPGSGADGQVTDVTVQSDGRILLAGDFTHLNGKTYYRVARMDHDGKGDWKVYWDTTGIQDQVINLRALIGDLAGNGIEVYSNGVTLDRTRPSYVSSTISPRVAKPGQTVTINLQTQDNLSGVDHTNVYVNTATDGSTKGNWNLVGTIAGCCGTVTWNTGGYSQGVYRIGFVIQDKAGNVNDWVYGSQPRILIPVFQNIMFLPFISR